MPAGCHTTSRSAIVASCASWSRRSSRRGSPPRRLRGSRRSASGAPDSVGDADVAGLAGDSLQPGSDFWVGSEVELALGRHMRVGVEADVGDAIAVADQKLSAHQTALECLESLATALVLLLPVALRWLEVEDPEEPRHRQVGLDLVLLEELPRKRLLALVAILRQIRRSLGEEVDD